MPIPIKPFYMIRHGETETNAANVLAGDVDTKLTPKGINQAKHARDVIAKLSEKPTIIYHSQLSRARDTATIINEALNLPMIEDPDWSEMNVGEWSEISKDITLPLFNAWETPPGGETPQNYWNRVKRAQIKALEETKDGMPLIVCHAGVMRVIGTLHGQDYTGAFKNAHLYEFRPAQDKNKPFPWDVWDYDLSEDGTKLVKTINTVYDVI